MRLPSSLPVISSRRGYSMVEVIVAIGLIGGIAVVATQFTTMFKTQKVSLKRSCEAYAHALINRVEAQTYYRQMVSFIPNPAAGRDVSTFGGGSGSAGAASSIVSNANLFSIAANRTVSARGGAGNIGVVLQNSQLIEGTMRDLAALYNNAGIGCAYGAYPEILSASAPGAPAIPAIPGELANVGVNAAAIRAQIRPFNRATGAQNCAGQVNPAPEGETTTSLLWYAFSNPGAGNLPPAPTGESYAASPPNPGPPALPANTRYATRGAGSDVNVGLELAVHIAYTQDGQPENCEVTQKFEYPRDRSPPAKPTATVTVNASNPALNLCAGAYSPTRAATVVITEAALEAGTQFLCRDLSWLRGWNNRGGGPYNGNTCVKGGAVNATRMDGLDNETPALQTFPRWPAVPEWIPCDMLRQCGKTPTSVTYNRVNGTNPNTNAGAHTLTIAYTAANELPLGCQINFEVIAVDTAGNTSIAGGARTYVSGPAATKEIHQMVCNVAGSQHCVRNAFGVWNDPSNGDMPGGYYKCGACCQNAPLSNSCRWWL